jgi:NitT/TauT family transport system permease protein/taurine transport system permease protein
MGTLKATGAIRVSSRIFLPFAALVLVWQVSAVMSGLPAYFYPTPAQVWAAFIALIDRGILPVYIADSFWRYVMGVAVGVGVALPTGVVMALSCRAGQAFMPFVNFFHAVVDMAWIPLFVLWFGYGLKTIVLSIAYAVFFPVLYNLMLGIQQVPLVMIHAVRTLGASRWQVVREVLMPGAMASLITGVRVGAGYAFRALISAEMIAGESNYHRQSRWLEPKCCS